MFKEPWWNWYHYFHLDETLGKYEKRILWLSNSGGQPERSKACRMAIIGNKKESFLQPFKDNEQIWESASRNRFQIPKDRMKCMQCMWYLLVLCKEFCNTRVGGAVFFWKHTYLNPYLKWMANSHPYSMYSILFAEITQSKFKERKYRIKYNGNRKSTYQQKWVLFPSIDTLLQTWV